MAMEEILLKETPYCFTKYNFAQVSAVNNGQASYQINYTDVYGNPIPQAPSVNNSFLTSWTSGGAAAPAPALIKTEYRTQKAKGVNILEKYGFNIPQYDIYGIEKFMENKNEHGQKFLFSMPKNVNSLVGKFVRPCPLVPRHGFVDSRKINTVEEAINIINETYAVEPQAEFIAMPFIDCKYSGIFTTGQLIVGQGNDGATSGKSSRMIPALGKPINETDHYYNLVLKEAGVNESPYFELLWTEEGKSHGDWDKQHYYTKFVQLRNGPLLPESLDFVPENVLVQNVVKAEGDLLEWETRAKQFPVGTVVYHPEGSLASHYAVHAVLNKIPVCISFEPKIGQIIQQTSKSSTPNAQAVKHGFSVGVTMPLTFKEAGLVMLVGCHSVSKWLGTQDVLLGMALGCAYRLIITAALGEVRHAPSRSRRASRSAVYTRCWDKIVHGSTRTRYIKAMDSFEKEEWPKSYGGKKWLEFSKYAGRIFNCVKSEDITGALSELNGATHAVHNGGWAFDKFLHKEVMDQTAINPAATMLNCAVYLYEAILSYEDKPNTSFFDTKKRYDNGDLKALTPEELKEAQDDDNEDDGIEVSEGHEYCSMKGCPKCHPAGACSCLRCHHLPEELVKNIVEMQVKPYFSSQSNMMHVQYKLKEMDSYSHVNIPISKTYMNVFNDIYEAQPKQPSFGISKSMHYIKATNMNESKNLHSCYSGGDWWCIGPPDGDYNGRGLNNRLIFSIMTGSF